MVLGLEWRRRRREEAWYRGHCESLLALDTTGKFIATCDGLMVRLRPACISDARLAPTRPAVKSETMARALYSKGNCKPIESLTEIGMSHAVRTSRQ